MAASLRQTSGLYFSVPFCRSKCTYCNFASGVYPASEHSKYVDRLVSDLSAAPAWARSMQVTLSRQVDTVYFGGGTPSLLSGDHFRQIFRAIRNEFMLTRDAEITVECAPGQLSDATLGAMVEVGVNRVSLGVQSFIDEEAHRSGRLHSRAQVLDDLHRLRSAGINNLNLDLLAGLAGQTLQSWRESLSVLIDTGVPHASVYMLEIDEESRLGRELLSGGARYGAELVPSDDAIVQMYEESVEALSEAGLKQYEISNFAQPGRESAHNLRYWQRKPYLGIGLDASSMLPAEDGSVLRAATTADLDEFLKHSDRQEPIIETSWLGPTQQIEEAWFLGLRRNAGVSFAALRKEFGAEAADPSIAIARRLADEGLLSIQRGKAALTSRGRLISNNVFAEFLGLGRGWSVEEEDCAEAVAH
ncbi:radical SAM family heme chaperone HemW [Acidicapsa dinghuensis]|uniref:Heme chaperone HemW n=1 Tax=Acidicapsa dinghuensis TaxID=2218256 RepID=A0ABW1EGL5_9BACT|nr:radical SAM family heme chaperone HemW [Acidicapsa dinghuensis]